MKIQPLSLVKGSAGRLSLLRAPRTGAIPLADHELSA
jgi:hypothetical protein